MEQSTYYRKPAVGVSRKEILRIYDMPESKSGIYLRAVFNTSTTLQVLELERCNLSSFDFILQCANLRYCALSDNLISCIPDLSSLANLQFLILMRNRLESTQYIANLKTCKKSLVYLVLKGNPVCAAGNYRHFVIKLLIKSQSRPKCLDNYVISDNEWLVQLNGTNKKISKLVLKPSYFISDSIMEIPSESIAYGQVDIAKYLDIRIRALVNISNSLSPVRRIQERLRFMIVNRTASKMSRALPHFQANVRRYLHISKLNRALFDILREYNCTHLFPASRLTYDNRKLLAFSTLKKFLRKFLAVTRRKLAARKILRILKKYVEKIKSFICWLQHNQVSGVMFSASNKSDILNCVHTLNASVKDIGNPRVRFSQEGSEHDVSDVLINDAVQLVPFLKLRLNQNRRDFLWSHIKSSVSKHRNISSLSSIITKKSHEPVDVPKRSPIRQRSAKFMKLSQKLQNMKEEKSSRKLDIDENLGSDAQSEVLQSSTPQFNRFQLRPSLTSITYLSKLCSSAERKMLGILKPRGNRLFVEEQRVLQRILELEFKSSEMRSMTEDIYLLPISNHVQITKLCALFRSITLQGIDTPHRNVYFNTVVVKDIAAVAIQRIIRGILCRKRSVAIAMHDLIQRRACIAIQRCWRLSVGLWQRLKLLHSINAHCRSITSSTLYLDIWVFYRLLRTRQLPILPISLTLFPEFRGIADVNDEGNCCFRHLSDDLQTIGEVNDNSGSNFYTTPIDELTIENENSSFASWLCSDDLLFSYNSAQSVRLGIPLWVPWRPPIVATHVSRVDHKVQVGGSKSKLSDSSIHHNVATRASKLWPYFDLLTKNVDICIEEVLPIFSSEEIEKIHRKLASSIAMMPVRLIRMQFSSMAEAKCRAALIMLSSYHSLSRTSVKLIPASLLSDRVRENSSQIAKQLTIYFERVETAKIGLLSLSPRTSKNNKTLIGVELFNNIWELRLTLTDAPYFYQIKDPPISDVVRLRLLVDYLNVLPDKSPSSVLHVRSNVSRGDTPNLFSNENSVVVTDSQISSSHNALQSSVSGRSYDQKIVLTNSIEDHRSIITSSTIEIDNDMESLPGQFVDSLPSVSAGGLSSVIGGESLQDGTINYLAPNVSNPRNDIDSVHGTSTELAENILTAQNCIESSSSYEEEYRLPVAKSPRICSPSEWVEESQMFSKLVNLIPSAKSDTLILGPVDLNMSNLWNRSRLLNWCGCNNESTFIVGDITQSAISDIHSKRLADADLETVEKRELLSRSKRNMAIIRPLQHDAMMEGDRTLRECRIVKLPVQPHHPQSRSTRFVRTKLRKTATVILTSPVRENVKVSNVTNNSEEFVTISPAPKTPDNLQRSNVAVGVTNCQHMDRFVSSDNPTMQEQKPRVLNLTIQRVQRLSGFEHETGSRNAAEADKLSKKSLTEVRLRIQAEKLGHDIRRKDYEQSIKAAGLLASVAGKIESSIRSSLKANRIKFLIGRVQTNTNRATSAALVPECAIRRPLTQNNFDDLPSDRIIGRPCTVSRTSSNGKLVARTSSRQILESAENPSFDAVVVDAQYCHDETPFASEQTQPAAIASMDRARLSAEANRRHSVMTMDSSFRRQSILTLNTIEIPSLDPRPNMKNMERLDSDNLGSSVGEDPQSPNMSILSPEPSLSIAMSGCIPQVSAPNRYSPPVSTPPIKSLEKYFKWKTRLDIQPTDPY